MFMEPDGEDVITVPYRPTTIGDPVFGGVDTAIWYTLSGKVMNNAGMTFPGVGLLKLSATAPGVWMKDTDVANTGLLYYTNAGYLNVNAIDDDGTQPAGNLLWLQRSNGNFGINISPNYQNHTYGTNPRVAVEASSTGSAGFTWITNSTVRWIGYVPSASSSWLMEDASGNAVITLAQGGAVTFFSTIRVPTSVSTALVISTAALGITPAAGSNLNVNLSTTGDLNINSGQFLVDTSAGTLFAGGTSDTSGTSAFCDARTLSTGSSGHGFACNAVITSTASIGFAPFDAKYTCTSTTAPDHLNGFQFRPTISHTGTLGTIYGYTSAPTVSSGTVTVLAHMACADVVSAGATINTQHGLFIPAMTGATANYGIRCSTNTRFDCSSGWNTDPATTIHLKATDLRQRMEGSSTSTAGWEIYTNSTLRWKFYNLSASTSFVFENASAAAVLTLAQTGVTVSQDLTFADAKNIIANATTGTKIGTATTQKLAFFNSTPIVQPANTVAIDDVLVNLGLRASGGPASFTAILKQGGVVRLTADATNATATMANITDLSETLVAGKKYEFRLILFVAESVAAEGIKIDFDGGNATMTSFRAHGKISDASLLLSTQTTAIATDFAVTTITGDGLIEVYGAFVVNGAGTFIPRFSQNTHTLGTATVYLNSHLVVEESSN